MPTKIPEHLKPFEVGQLCYVVRRRYRGTGRYRLLLHEAKPSGNGGFSYGSGGCWLVDPPKPTTCRCYPECGAVAPPSPVKKLVKIYEDERDELRTALLELGCAIKGRWPKQLRKTWEKADRLLRCAA